MDYNFQSKLKTNPKVPVACKITVTKPTVNSTNSLVKPRQISALNQQTNNNQTNNQPRPTSPKITKRINSSSLVQPQANSNFIQSRLNSKTNSTTSQNRTAIKKPTSTFNSQLTKPLSINSSVNRLNSQTQIGSKLSNSRAGSSSSIKSREPSKKQLVKDTISNSAFVPREKLEKLTKKHEELTNKYNFSSQLANKNQLTVDALSCLINYMAIDLEAFKCPSLKKRVNYLETVEQELQQTILNLNSDNEKVNTELEFEKQRSQKEKCNLLEMFEVEMKTVERNYLENLKMEQAKSDKLEKDLLYLKQNLSKDKKIDFLNKEIESLKTVLELKDNEIKELRYRLDRTFVDKDEINQLRNERDNLSLAKEQLEYSLNMKNEELKFVLHENTSLASLHSLNSLTSTPLNNDRNNNVVNKKRKTVCKKQKLDSTSDEDHNFIKPLNLHKERFGKTPADKQIGINFDKDLDNEFEEGQLNKYLDNNFINNQDEETFNQPLVDEEHFVKQLNDNDACFKKPFDVQNTRNEDHVDHFLTNQLESNDKQMEVSLNNSLNNSLNKSLEKSSDKLLDRSLDKSFDKLLDLREKSLDSPRFNNKSFSKIEEKKENSQNNSFSSSLNNKLINNCVKPFDINEIKERCFKKPVIPIDAESSVKPKCIINDEMSSNIKQINKISTQLAINSPPENFIIKTCQIVNDESQISIIKNKKLESVLDSGFSELL